MRSNHKFLPTLFAVAFSFIFLDVFPALSSLDRDEDKVKKFELTQTNLGRTGLAYKALKNLLGEAGEHGASITTSGRATLKITDKEKFKKAFRDMHLSVLHSLGENQSGLRSCEEIERFRDYEDGDMRRIRINGFYLFNITSQRAIAKAFSDDDQGLLEMLNKTVSALKLYSTAKLDPDTLRIVQGFIEGDSAAPGNGTAARRQPNEDEEDSPQERIRKLRALDHKQKAEIEEVKARLQLSAHTVKLQEESIGLYQSFQTILNYVLDTKEIDRDQFGAAIDEKDGEGIKNLLSAHFEGLSVDDLIEELNENWQAKGDEGEEQGEEQGGGDVAHPDEDAVQGNGTFEPRNIARDEGAEENNLKQRVEKQKAEIEEVKAELQLSAHTVKLQEDSIGLYQSFQIILNYVLDTKEIDRDQFGAAIDEKDSDGVKKLLSNHFEELAVDDLIEELNENWQANGDEREEHDEDQRDDSSL